MDWRLGTPAIAHGAHRWPWLLDAVLAVVLAALTLPVGLAAVRDASWSTGLQVLTLAVLVVGHGAVAVRRSAPQLALAVVGAVMLLLLALPDLDTSDGGAAFSPILLPSVLVFPVVLYTVAAWCPSRTSLLALGAALAGCVLVLVRLWGADYLTVAQPGLTTAQAPVRSWPLFLVLGTATAVLLPWSVGRYRHLHTSYVHELEERARREEQDRVEGARRAAREERARIAREMHDVVAHSLSVMVSQAEGGRMMAAKDPARTVPVLETVARTGQDAMRDMSALLRALHEDESSGPVTPQPGLDDLPALVARVRRSGLEVRVEERGERLRVSRAAELAVYRVVQESLTNVLRHAGDGARTHVLLDWQSGCLGVTIRNSPGVTALRAAGSGRGLAGMTERVTVLGGSLEAAPAADGGFAVRAEVPTLVGRPEGAP